MAVNKVLAGMASGLVSAGIVMSLTAMWLPIGLISSLITRWHIASVAVLAPTLSLVVCIARLAAHRFNTPEDIDGSALSIGTQKAKLLQAILQNTLEQMAIAIPVYTAWCILAPERFVGVVLSAASLFLIGRILFSFGYQKGASGRAFGFALTFYPTVALLLGLIFLAFRIRLAY